MQDGINYYAYAGNSPLCFTDPLGLDAGDPGTAPAGWGGMGDPGAVGGNGAGNGSAGAGNAPAGSSGNPSHWGGGGGGTGSGNGTGGGTGSAAGGGQGSAGNGAATRSGGGGGSSQSANGSASGGPIPVTGGLSYGENEDARDRASKLALLEKFTQESYGKEPPQTFENPSSTSHNQWNKISLNVGIIEDLLRKSPVGIDFPLGQGREAEVLYGAFCRMADVYGHLPNPDQHSKAILVFLTNPERTVVLTWGIAVVGPVWTQDETSITWSLNFVPLQAPTGEDAVSILYEFDTEFLRQIQKDNSLH